MSARVNITANNTTQYTLSLYQQWGKPYTSAPPKIISPLQRGITFALDDNDRGGVVYLAKDAEGNEMGFVTMSFTCPKNSHNSAEGSHDKAGFFVAAGLQKYKRTGTPVDFTYDIGTPNKASWNNGSSDDGGTECDQTSMESWARVLVSVENPTTTKLTDVKTWQNGPWTREPEDVPANSRRIFLLNDNDRAGIYYKLDGNIPIHMSFTCPKNSSNSAEGSPLAGLRSYAEHGTPVLINYKIGEINQACWAHGDTNDGEIECPKTNVGYLNSWMQDSLAVIGTKTLKDICIVGSHDAGMSSIEHATVGGTACNTLTQTESIIGQLQYGSRYFDVRPAIWGGEYYTGHFSFTGNTLEMQGACGQSIDSIVSDINTFTENNKELVIIIFGESYDTDQKDDDGKYKKFTDVQYEELFKKFSKIKHLHIVDDFPDLTSIKLNTYIKNSACVLVVGGTKNIVNKYKGKGFFKGGNLTKHRKGGWDEPTSHSFNEMSKHQIAKMQKDKTEDSWFLLNWGLTQTETQAAGCGFDPTGSTSSIIDLANEANEKLSNKLFPSLTSSVYPNLIYSDNICTGNSTAFATYINRFRSGFPN